MYSTHLANTSDKVTPMKPGMYVPTEAFSFFFFSLSFQVPTRLELSNFAAGAPNQIILGYRDRVGR